jgi:hypothetical protein
MAFSPNLPWSFLVSLKRNAISVFFPLIAAGLIYSDYSYTQKCKALSARNQPQEDLEYVNE